MGIQVGDLMSSRVVTVEMDDALSMVKSLMEKASIHHLPVIDSQRRVIGIVSDRDLLRAMSPFLDTAAENARDLAVMRKPVHQIMAHNPLAIEVNMPLDKAAYAMLDNDISSLPVISEDGPIMGIITWKDLIRHCAKSSFSRRFSRR
jgi:acetoin utilization protein AcuB